MSRMHSDDAFVARDVSDHLQRITPQGVEADLESFVYMMSADLRRATKAIATIPEWLDAEVVGKDAASPDMSEAVELLAQHTRHIDKMLHHLMSFARVGRLQDVSKLDLTALIYTVAAAIDVPDRVTLRCLGPLPQFCMGAKDAAQMFTCLLENVVAHTGDAPVTVTFAADVQDGVLELCVTDTGPGIPPAHIQRLFRPLAHMPSASGQARAGMGLAIVHRVVTEYRGDIWAGPGRSGAGLELRLRLHEAPQPIFDQLLAPSEPAAG